MKRLSITAMCLVGFLSLAQSQESRKVISVEPQYSDVLNVLKLMDIHLFRFDLTPFLDKKYSMNVFVDEFENNKKTRRVRTIKLGHNIKSLNDIPEEHRALIRESMQIPEEKNEWDNIKEISAYIRNLNDSTSAITINVPGVIQTGCALKLHRIGDYKRHFYQVRPFDFVAIGKEQNLSIPLILYGSGWLDGQVIRFCGESKIDPQMKSEILTNLPYHYVLGLELEEVEY